MVKPPFTKTVCGLNLQWSLTQSFRPYFYIPGICGNREFPLTPAKLIVTLCLIRLITYQLRHDQSGTFGSPEFQMFLTDDTILEEAAILDALESNKLGKAASQVYAKMKDSKKRIFQRKIRSSFGEDIEAVSIDPNLTLHSSWNYWHLLIELNNDWYWRKVYQIWVAEFVEISSILFFFRAIPLLGFLPTLPQMRISSWSVFSADGWGC